MSAAAIPLGFGPALYERRQWVASAATFALYLGFAYLGAHLAIRNEAPANPAPITVTLAEPPPEAPKPPPPKIEPVPQPVARPAPRTPQASAAPVSSPIAPSPSAVAAPVSVPDVPQSPVTPKIPEIPAKVEPPPPRSDPGAEGRFAQDIRARVEKQKVYPATARELGMSGTVEVMYLLDRTGKLLKAEVLASSGYPPLDQAALRAVRGATYAAMPDDAWVGERQKEFRTKLVFSIDY